MTVTELSTSLLNVVHCLVRSVMMNCWVSQTQVYIFVRYLLSALSYVNLGTVVGIDAGNG